ncbi:MAG: hypothetical protein KKC11_05290 [Candidatus Omnitrophica bacterium]|nr:hypothetical protein [Candidatus Omnitrophota bacterium]MBU0896889.1 hypothetical protein [Candidatus Omnitrophota bacterium]MBU1810053.1 hypothetical protein [Candidatus Omnitrophota bacterium]
MEQVLKEFKEEGIEIRKGGGIKGRKKLDDETIKQIRKEIEVWIGRRPLSELGWDRWKWMYCRDETKEALVEMFWRLRGRKAREKLKLYGFCGFAKKTLGKSLEGLLCFHQRVKNFASLKETLRNIINNGFHTTLPSEEEIVEILINPQSHFEANDAKGFLYRWPRKTTKVLVDLANKEKDTFQKARYVIFIDYSLIRK